jgi:sulfatase-like protein
MDKIVNMNEIVKNAHILFVTLDSLRYDVADELFRNGQTPVFQQNCPQGWQKGHSPGNFTYAAHHAFFAGFLPTPAQSAKSSRLFAARFSGSETTTTDTLVFDTQDIISGFAQLGFRTICIGGVGFFNQQTPLGRVLPSFFEESYWEPSFGVTDPDSTRHQFYLASRLAASVTNEQLFMFINVSAIHQPNYFYQLQTEASPALPRTGIDTISTHGEALKYVDGQFPLLFEAFTKTERDTFCIFCSDHGTAYGEDNYYGHRIGHPTVWEVPMATFMLKKANNDHHPVQ